MSWSQPGEARFGVHSVDHFALEVPSLGTARHFFTAFGLDVRDAAGGGGLELRTFGADHVWMRLLEGPQKRLAWLSLSCWGDELDGLAAQAETAGARRAQADPRAASADGHWFHDPEGNLLQLKVGPKVTPSGLGERPDFAPRAGQRGVLGRSSTAAVRPRRLSHVLLYTGDLDRAIDFYRDALGLRLSDRSGKAIAFLHGRHGSDHHLVAFAGSHGRGWHHSAWDVAGLDEVGRGAAQMSRAGYGEGWGTGRHVLGSNFFHYVRDPWGSFAEYSAEIDFIPTGAAWPSADHPPEDALNLWGPEVPSNFVENSEV